MARTDKDGKAAKAAGKLAKAGNRAAEQTHGPRRDSPRRDRAAWRDLAADDDQGEGGLAAGAEAIWHSWCRAPDEDAWDLLSQWRDPAELAEAACAAALTQLVAAGEVGTRQPRAAFCVAYGLAPADPVQRVLFYLLTGQEAQCHAADPDGGLATRAYAAADDATRALLRRALARSGGLDLLRIIAGGDPGGRMLVPAERGYLASRLRSRRDWAGLWQVVRDMPAGEAASWLPRFGDGWSPADDRDRALFRVLRSADPQRVGDGLAVIATRSSCVQAGEPPIRSVALSARGWRLAVCTTTQPGRAGHRDQTAVTEFDLADGTVATAFCLRPPPGFLRAWYLGDTLAVADLRDSAGHPNGTVYRHAGGDLVALPEEVNPGQGIFAGPVSSPPGGVGVLEGSRVRLHACDGTLAGTVTLAPRRRPPRSFVAGPGGLLAVFEYDRLALYDTGDPGQPRLIGVAAEAGSLDACFPVPGYLVVQGRAALRAWRFAGPGPRPLVADDPEHGLLLAAEVPDTAAGGGRRYRPCLAAIPGGDAVALVDASGMVACRDPRTLADVPVPDWVPASEVDLLWGARGDAGAAVVSGGSVTVLRARHPAAAIAERPAREWRPGDLTAMTAALADPALHPVARPLAELLRDCLDCRFGAEVRIGQVGALPPPEALGTDEIALGGRG